MKQLKQILASMALTCFALFPAAASAADIDDLDVTMEVLDSIAGLDGQVMEMRGPEADPEGPDGDGEPEEEGNDDPEGESDDAREEENEPDEQDDAIPTNRKKTRWSLRMTMMTTLRPMTM
jgi:hypothetical protein